MKKLILVPTILLFLTGCEMFRKPPSLVCDCEEKQLHDTIQQMFDADSILLYSKLLQEELDFPEIRAIVVCVINGTTNMLDFKTLPAEPYNSGCVSQIVDEKLENYHQIEESLQQEARKVARLIFEKCGTKEFNDIIVEFFKYDIEGEPYYRFITHHYELFETGLYSDSD